MFEKIVTLVIRRAWVVLLGWAVFAGLLWVLAPSWSVVSRDDDVRFFPPDSPSVIGHNLTERGFPSDVSSSSVVLIAERAEGPLSRDDLAFVDRVSARLKALKEKDPDLGIKQVVDHNEPVVGARLIGSRREGDKVVGQAVVTYAQLRGTYVSRDARRAVDRVVEEVEALQKDPKTKPPQGLNLATTGSSAVGRDTNMASKASVDATTFATIALVIVILLAVYRSPLLAMVPMATIALSVWVSLMAIALLTRVPWLNFQVIGITNVFVVVVLFGAGTDYCLFLIARYREELFRSKTSDQALGDAIRQVGGALVASAGTVILGLGMLWFSTFAKIQYTGPAIALSLAIGLVASLTLAPVLLHWLRGAVFWPFKPPHHRFGADPEVEAQEDIPLAGFWAAISDWIVRHPALILAVSVLVLTPFAVVGLRTQSSYDLLADLGPEQPSIIGTRIFQRYFPVGELGPSTVLIHHPELDFTTAQGKAAVAALSKDLAALRNVHEIRSVSQPLGKPGAEVLLQTAATFAGRGQEFRDKVNAHYVSTQAKEPADRNHITRIDVIFGTGPFSAQSLATLEQVRDVVARAKATGAPLASPQPVTSGLGGTTVQIDDLKRVTTTDQHRMYVLVTLGVYAILVVLLRRPGICLYLIATVVLGYLASLGVTELVFRAMHTGPDPWTGLDWKVGFFLFVILVAVGEDYNIFLMARVIEEERKHGPIEGTRRAVAHTGGIISSCGIIMAGTFASMLVGSLTALRELGFALGLGVLLDTFIVRPILVPAFVVLIHRSRGQAASAPAPIQPIEATTSSATP